MTSPDPRIAFFDYHARSWDDDGPPAAQTLARLDTLRPTLPLGPGQELLEVGCGTGQVTAWLTRCVEPGRVTAVDFSPAMIEKARARGTTADFRCADVCTDALGFERFDVAWLMHCYPHFRDGAAALRNIAQALMPEGSLIILHLDSWANINAFHAAMGGVIASDKLPDPGEWPGLIQQAGLQLVELSEGEDLFYLRAQKPAP